MGKVELHLPPPFREVKAGLTEVAVAERERGMLYPQVPSQEASQEGPTDDKAESVALEVITPSAAALVGAEYAYERPERLRTNVEVDRPDVNLVWFKSGELIGNWPRHQTNLTCDLFQGQISSRLTVFLMKRNLPATNRERLFHLSHSLAIAGSKSQANSKRIWFTSGSTWSSLAEQWPHLQAERQLALVA